jgi:hypothetical protein
MTWKVLDLRMRQAAEWHCKDHPHLDAGRFGDVWSAWAHQLVGTAIDDAVSVATDQHGQLSILTQPR